jgi:hypothetical protein
MRLDILVPGHCADKHRIVFLARWRQRRDTSSGYQPSCS